MSIVASNRASINLSANLPDGFFAPQPYGIWLPIVTLIVVIVIVSLLVVTLLNIFKSTKDYISNVVTKNTTSPKKNKAKCLASLERIYELYKLGQLTDDQVYLEVSKSLRIYASERTNVDFTSSTKRDLKKIDGIIIFTQTIDRLYELEFADRKNIAEPLTPEGAINLVQTVVKKW
ncbi:MAG: hypothetical protein LBC50_01710 [Candidatus Ancillula sp.]|jgi:hypothetical protein|nr:hypothetical protein [Candidatus Ancillula sp.]